MADGAGAAAGPGGALSSSAFPTSHEHSPGSINAQEGEFRVFVSGLKWCLTDSEFYDEANKFGAVANVHIMKHASGKSRGIGYLNYGSRAEMMAALDRIDQAEEARYNQAAVKGGGSQMGGMPEAMPDQRFDAAGASYADMSSGAFIPPPKAPLDTSAANVGGLGRQEKILGGGHDSGPRGVRGGGGENMEGGLHHMSNTSLAGNSVASTSNSLPQTQAQKFSLKSLGGGPLRLRENFERSSGYPY